MWLIGGEDAQRTAGAAVLGRAAAEVLGPLEQRQHILVAPAGVAEMRPRVVVLRWPRTWNIPLTELEPPSTLPRGMSSRRPLQPGCGTVVYAQSSGLPQSSQSRPGSWIAGFSSIPPASITHTRAPASTRRRATTAPPLPEPTTITSYGSATRRSYDARAGASSSNAATSWSVAEKNGA